MVVEEVGAGGLSQAASARALGQRRARMRRAISGATEHGGASDARTEVSTGRRDSGSVRDSSGGRACVGVGVVRSREELAQAGRNETAGAAGRSSSSSSSSARASERAVDGARAAGCGLWAARTGPARDDAGGCVAGGCKTLGIGIACTARVRLARRRWTVEAVGGCQRARFGDGRRAALDAAAVRLPCPDVSPYVPRVPPARRARTVPTPCLHARCCTAYCAYLVLEPPVARPLRGPVPEPAKRVPCGVRMHCTYCTQSQQSRRAGGRPAACRQLSGPARPSGGGPLSRKPVVMH